MPSSFADLVARLDALASDDPSASVSVWLGDLAGRCRWSHRADAPHYAASTMKLPLVIAAQRRVVRGELDLDAPLPVRNAFASVLDGSPFTMDEDDDQDPETWAAVGATRTLRELAEHAITHSGNLATNLLLDVVGRDEVAEVVRLAGCSPTTVVGRGIEDAVARAAGITNTVTAADLGLLMAAVARREPALGGPPVCEPVEQILERQQHVDQIPAGLPSGTPTASKSGWIPGVSHDVALVRPAGEDPFVLSICTTIELGEHEAAAFVASVAADVWAADHARHQAHDVREVQR
ncbi:serine hydrolase [Humibacillus xanthopallidus]|uniref:Beta-lactamase class A n=1 Tax=Humibacillus xanthopallidus TaxID=412689 RepID=A0A543HWK5_9MICO|nr:serine hydrolase [Humibacillus xanthopallidus]TQM62743.1 beta-lactamase class A [Humibacillus xanthopallidus]